jgi:UDP-N-acetylglucosamine 2-epimerase (non-hydrolysing)
VYDNRPWQGNVLAEIRPLLVIGTRPEVIKMAPVALECRRRAEIAPVICFTGQHRDLAESASGYFDIVPDVNLEAMRPGTSLSSLLARCVEGLDAAVERYQPTCLVAQGDTSSVLAASLVAFYRRLPFVHVEAGLRTGNLQAPWPEEMHRRAAGMLATTHCAPTRRAAENLLREGAPENAVHVTGNTIVDALQYTLARKAARAEIEGRYVLATMHRRENFGGPMAEACRALAELAGQFDDVQWVIPLHPNPQAGDAVRARLGNLPNVRLVPPLDYPKFVALLDGAEVVVTDSGGVQEEAVSLGKSVFVLRETTERPEGVEAGYAKLVGSSYETIVREVSQALKALARSARPAENPYGDGQAARRIVDLMMVR